MQVDVAFDIDVAMPMYNLIEDSDNYSKTSNGNYGNVLELNQLKILIILLLILMQPMLLLIH